MLVQPPLPGQPPLPRPLHVQPPLPGQLPLPGQPPLPGHPPLPGQPPLPGHPPLPTSMGYPTMHPLLQPPLPHGGQSSQRQGFQPPLADPARAHAHVHLSPQPAQRRGAPPLPPTPYAPMPPQGAPPRPPSEPLRGPMAPSASGTGRVDPLGLEAADASGALQPPSFARSASIDAAEQLSSEQLSSGEQLLARDLALLLNDDFDM